MNQKRTGKLISSLRKSKNMTQGMLAEKMGVSINAVSKWERGLSFPDVSLYKNLCAELGISVEELINGERVYDVNDKTTNVRLKDKKLLIEFIFLIVITALMIVGIIAFKYLSDKRDDNISDYYERNYQMSLVGRNVEMFLKYKNDGKFPEYYGGMYISDDSYNLVVQIVKDKIPKKGTMENYSYNELFTVSDYIKVEYVKNSYNDLEYVFNVINEYMMNNEMPEEFNAVGIDVGKNMVVVNYREIYDNDKKEFREKIIDSDLVEFERALDNVDNSIKCKNYLEDLGDEILDKHYSEILISVKIESREYIPVSLNVYDDGTYELYTAYQGCKPGRICNMMLKYIKSIKGIYNYDINKIIEEASKSEYFIRYSGSSKTVYEVTLGERYLDEYDTLTFNVERGIKSFYLDEFLNSINVDLLKCARSEY